MRLRILAVLILVAPVTASAQAMNAEQFYKRATALQKKGVMALFSMGDVKALTAEGQAAATRASEGRKAALAAKRTPRFCPPPGPGKMDDKEFMARLSAIPAADRSKIDMAEAMNRILAAKYPCRS
jgi:hypothetical protein